MAPTLDCQHTATSFFETFESCLRATNKMQQNALVTLSFGAVAVIIILMAAPMTGEAAVISCPPSGAEVSPNHRQLCFAIEQAINDIANQQDSFPGRLMDERNTNINAKRQDVDHVFLRFGKRFLL